MRSTDSPRPSPRSTPAAPPAHLCALAAALALAGTPAMAQYKVVAPDGSVTYTDRPQATSSGAKVTAIGRSGAPRALADGSAAAALPLELRSVAARFPVTLYTSADCPPCDSGRALLRQRGIPYAERSIATEDDGAALQRLTGARNVPTLAVGQQVQRGLLEAEWQTLLDLAGYPRESKLPPGWQPAPAAPLVGRAAPPPAPVAAAPAPEPPPPAAPPAAESPPSKFRF